jgi:uncharacterized protein YceK
MKRIILALTILGLLPCTSVIPLIAQDDQANKIEEGKKMWDKWMEARGGRGRLSTIKDIQSTADVRLVTQGLNLTLITYKKGLNKYRQDQKVMGMTITQTINGEKGWMSDPATGSIVDMPKEVQGQLSAPANEHEALLDPEKFGHIVTYEGRKTILAKEYILLNQRSKEGVVVTHYIDPDTFLRYKYAFIMSNVPYEVIESDYRDIDGIKVPFLQRQLQSGNEVAIIMVKEYKFNTNLADSLFDRNAQATSGRKEIVVPPETLAKFVGTYKLTPQLNLMITLEGNQLYTQASGQNKFPLFAESETKFFLKVLDIETEFVKDSKGVVTHLVYRQAGNELTAPRISDTVLVRKEINVDPKILAQYAGTYELKPGFDMVITLEGDKLFSQATGQSKVQIFPETETKFFLKVVDAQIEFLKDDKGAVTHLMLDQGPAHIEAPRK